MPTVDNNGLPTFLGTDPMDFDGLLNQLSAATSSALNEQVRIFKAANTSARTAIANKFPPTQQDPLLVWRQDNGTLTFNDGSGWVVWPNYGNLSGTPGPNEIIIGGTVRKRSGRFSANVEISTKTGNMYRGVYKWKAPYTPPSGWAWNIVVWTNASGKRSWTGYCSGTTTKNVSIGVLSPTSTGKKKKRKLFFDWSLIRSSSTG